MNWYLLQYVYSLTFRTDTDLSQDMTDIGIIEFCAEILHGEHKVQ